MPNFDNRAGWGNPFGDGGFGNLKPAGVEAENKQLKARVVELETRLSCLDGTDCAEDRAMGNGGCGACVICCREATADRDDGRLENNALRARVAGLKSALNEVVAECDRVLALWEKGVEDYPDRDVIASAAAVLAAAEVPH